MSCIAHALHGQFCQQAECSGDSAAESWATCSSECAVLKLFGDCSSPAWQPLLPRLAMTDRTMMECLLKEAKPDDDEWYRHWMEMIDSTVLVKARLETVGSTLYANPMLSQVWQNYVTERYRAAYSQFEGWSGGLLPDSSAPLYRSSMMSAEAIFKRMAGMKGVARVFWKMRGSPDAEWQEGDDDAVTTFDQWMQHGKRGQYFVDAELDATTHHLLIATCPVHLLGYCTDLNRICARSGFHKPNMNALGFCVFAMRQGLPIGTPPHFDCRGIGVSLHTTVTGPQHCANLVTLYPVPHNQILTSGILAKLGHPKSPLECELPYSRRFRVPGDPTVI